MIADSNSAHKFKRTKRVRNESPNKRDMQRTFPRAKQKSIIKKYQRKARFSRNVDILIFLDYVLFLKRLAVESNVKAQENKEKTLQAHHVNGVLRNVLKSCKG